jgi:hypothetical protein
MIRRWISEVPSKMVKIFAVVALASISVRDPLIDLAVCVG